MKLKRHLFADKNNMYSAYVKASEAECIILALGESVEEAQDLYVQCKAKLNKAEEVLKQYADEGNWWNALSLDIGPEPAQDYFKDTP